MAEQALTRDEIMAEILAAIPEDEPPPEDGWRSTAEIAAGKGLPTAKMQRKLVKLEERGVLERWSGGSGKVDYWRLKNNE